MRARLSVFRSNKYIYAQIIDDEKRQTLVAASQKDVNKLEGTKTQRAHAVGLALAKKAEKKKIEQVAFDRGSFAYKGRVKALAEGARAGGLKF